ncbi:MAG: FtsX-like permease family protein [Anaerolineales bacterium]
MRPRWAKVWSDLWTDRRRTGLVIASIAVGVFAVGVIIGAYTVLAQDINRGFAATNPPNIEISTDPFHSVLVDVIGKEPGVRQVEGRSIIPVRAHASNESWQDVKLVGMPEDGTRINLLKSLDGRLGVNKDEALVSKDLLHNTGFRVGDVIEIQLPDGSDHNLTIVGLVSDQTTSEPSVDSNNNVYISIKTMDSLGLDRAFNTLFVTVDGTGDNPTFINSVAADVEEKVKDSNREVYRTDKRLSTQHPMIDTVLAMLGVLAAMGVLVAVLGSSLIFNTLNALLNEQRRQIGVMKLVGARNGQVMGMYFMLIVSYGLIALAVAVPLSAIFGYAFAWGIATLLGAVIGSFRVLPLAIAAQLMMGLLLPLGAGFVPVSDGARTNVKKAIRGRGTRGGELSSRMLMVNSRGLRWIPRPILLSFRNTFRQTGRLLLTIFTLTMAGAVFIAVFNVRDSMNNVVSQVMQHFLGDVSLEFRRPYRVAKVRQTLMGVPGVTGVEAWGGTSGEIWDAKDNLVTNLNISAPPQDTQLLHPEFITGRWLLPGETNAMVVSEKIYKYYPDIKVGDSLIVKLPGERKEAWQVVGVFRLMSLSNDPLAYATFDFMADATHMHNEAASYRIVTQAHDGASQKALAERIDNHLNGRGFAVGIVQTGARQQSLARQGIDVLILFLLIMALLTASVGSIGLAGTMSINVLERTREIGVMRTIGAVDRVIMQSVIIEGLVISLMTWGLAIAASFPISYSLLGIIGEAISGSEIALRFTPLGMLYWLAIVVVLSVLASLVPARNAARLTINEVLAYE